MTGPIRVVVVDDEALVRGGFRAILDHQSDIEVVGEAADGADAITVCSHRHPDVVLMDLRMPGMDGIEATRRIAHPDGPRVLILTTFDLDEHVYSALSNGASGFLTKTPRRSVSPTRSGPSRGRHAAVTFGDPPAGGDIHPPATTGTSTPTRLAALTPRELDVLREVARGDTNADIARRLFLSEATIKTHVTRILAKLAVPDRVHAVVLAYECGLVRPGDNQ